MRMARGFTNEDETGSFRLPAAYAMGAVLEGSSLNSQYYSPPTSYFFLL